jgi:hypothetical protein
MENNQPRKYPAAARDYDQCPKAAEFPSLVLAQVSFCLVLFNVSHAARCTACQGVRSHPVPVALVGECSVPVVRDDHIRIAILSVAAPVARGARARARGTCGGYIPPVRR